MRIGVDIGGTFTDFVCYDERSGELRRLKLLSTPAAPARAVALGLQQLGRDEIREVVHGSTVATNAVLERKGATTAFVGTRGFRDLLHIGRQNRADLYDLAPTRPTPLVPEELCFEVEERVAATGEVLQPLEEGSLDRLVTELLAASPESVSVCLLFSFLKPKHERRIGDRLRAHGLPVSLSTEVLPEFREFERASTTTLNAYVLPLMERYLSQLAESAPGAAWRVMQSNGGSLELEEARAIPARTILSGPAAGVVGARRIAQEAGFERILTFDMGGTSTDVSLSDGSLRLTREASIGGLPISLPMVDLHTVGAGGGSIATMDSGGALRVGPRSAGAEPGPICYGRGGKEPTVTDANLVLGRLIPAAFDAGDLRLDTAAAEAGMQQLAAEAGIRGTDGLRPAVRAALGVIDVVNVQMARALRVVSVDRGYLPEDFTLVCFGGAGGLHASALARSLGVPRVLVPYGASTLSAYGLLVAEVVRDWVQTAMLPGDSETEALSSRFADMKEQARRDMARQGFTPESLLLRESLDIRYQGQSYELPVPFSSEYVAQFHESHEQAYGYKLEDRPIEIVNLRLRAEAEPPALNLSGPEAGRRGSNDLSSSTRRVVFSTGLQDAPLHTERELIPGAMFSGPALVLLPDTLALLEPGDECRVDSNGNLLIEVAG